MIRLLYCSVSTLEHLHAIDEVGAIVKTSIAHNDRNDITGALIFTGEHFAQALEGEAGAVDQLMASIRADPRHRLVTEVDRDDITDRQFRNWAMAYRGPATYVDRSIEKLFSPQSAGSHARAIERIYDLMTEFAK